MRNKRLVEKRGHLSEGLFRKGRSLAFGICSRYSSQLCRHLNTLDSTNRKALSMDMSRKQDSGPRRLRIRLLIYS